MSESILFVSGKGGVGKSSLCLQIAAGLARRGRRVLVAEASCGFRGLELSLGLAGETVYDLSDALEERCSLGDALLTHEKSRLRLMPAPGDPFYLPREEKLAAFFAWGQERWDFVLVDGPSGFGPFAAMLARHCSLGILVTVPQEIPAHAAGTVSSLLAREGLRNQRLIINRVPRDFTPGPVIRDLDDVIDLAGAQLIGAVPEQPELPPPGEEPASGLLGQELEAIARRLLGERVELTLSP